MSISYLGHFLEEKIVNNRLIKIPVWKSSCTNVKHIINVINFRTPHFVYTFSFKIWRFEP